MNKFHNPGPPRFALFIFRRFFKAEFQEDIEGDLLERYERDICKKGLRPAQWLFVKDVFFLLRPNLLAKPSLHLHFQTMKTYQFIRLSMVGMLATGFICYIFRNGPGGIEKGEFPSPDQPGEVQGFFPVTERKIIMSPDPVSNKDWADFLHFIASDSAFTTDYVQSMVPDGWDNKKDLNPVEGVSWLQAQEFCKWRSVMSTYYETNGEKAGFHEMLEKNRLSKRHITYRLPTELEWGAMVNTKKLSHQSGFICVVSEKILI